LDAENKSLWGLDGMNTIYIGWDSTQEIAYQVLEWSIRKHARRPVEIRPLKLEDMKTILGFERPQDPLQSTEFTYTRFLVPALQNYGGVALFLDCDMLALGDVTELFDLPMDGLALRVVKHDHAPIETTKMGDKPQTAYPRKNWSSLMLLQCEMLKCWTIEAVTKESGAWLHRFDPIPDEQIGELDGSIWNVLDRYDDATKITHYTSGGPWLKGCEQHPYGGIWRLYRKGLMRDALNLRFELGGVINLPYFYHPKNMTWMNERCVELPIVCALAGSLNGKRVLEVGDVLSQYERYVKGVDLTVVDLQSAREGVQARDILQHEGGPYDLIISVSTLEHVGKDDLTSDHSRAIDAIKYLAKLLAPNGRLVFTVPVGYNKVLDEWLLAGWFGKNHYAVRVSGRENRWVATDEHLIKRLEYGRPYQAANGLIIGEYNKSE
jgi:SAM-dependent methyltransferase